MPENYRKWKINFCRHALDQSNGIVFTGNFSAILTINTTTSRCPSDADNCLASVLDALQFCGIITNDKKSRAGSYFLSYEKHESDHMIVTVTEMAADKYPVKTTKKKTKK